MIESVVETVVNSMNVPLSEAIALIMVGIAGIYSAWYFAYRVGVGKTERQQDK